MDTAPQASASEAAATALLTGFHYPSGKLGMSPEFLEHQDEILLSATKRPLLPCIPTPGAASAPRAPAGVAGVSPGQG